MSTWREFEHEQPALAAAIKARFTVTKHHVIATLRRDGSPRVSGTEVDLRWDDLYLGSMPQARKAIDLRRDPRCAIHANPGDGSMAGGDAKVGGRAVEITDADVLARFTAEAEPPEPFHLFRLDLTEATLTSLHPDGDRLVIETWRPGEELRRVERR